MCEVVGTTTGANVVRLNSDYGKCDTCSMRFLAHNATMPLCHYHMVARSFKHTVLCTYCSIISRGGWLSNATLLQRYCNAVGCKE